MHPVLKNILIALVFVAAFKLYSAATTENVGAKLAAGNQVVMYSLTTCPYCKQMRGVLQASGIPFTEYYMDADDAKKREFFEQLAASNVPPGGVGTPSFNVNGALLLNNPPLAEIKRHLRFKPS